MNSISNIAIQETTPIAKPAPLYRANRKVKRSFSQIIDFEMSFGPYKIRPVFSKEEKQAVYRLRYQIACLEQNQQLQKADHINQMLTDEVDNTAIIIGVFTETDETLVGTLRINLSLPKDFPHADFFHLENYERKFPGKVCMASKLFISEKHRKTRLFSILMIFLYDLTKAHDVKVTLLGCCSYMAPIFNRIGFVQYTAEQDVSGYGTSIAMRFVYDSEERLRQIGSPLLNEKLRNRCRWLTKFQSAA